LNQNEGNHHKMSSTSTLVKLPVALLKKFDIGKCYACDNVVKTKDGKSCWIVDAARLNISTGLSSLKYDILSCRDYEEKNKTGTRLMGLARAQNANVKYTDQLKAFLEEGKLQLPVVPEDVIDESGGVKCQLHHEMAFVIDYDSNDDEEERLDQGLGKIIAINELGAEEWIRKNVVAIDKHEVEDLVGKLPNNYLTMPDDIFAQYLDLAYEIEETKKHLEKLKKSLLKLIQLKPKRKNAEEEEEEEVIKRSKIE
jgi:hypothetical protein